MSILASRGAFVVHLVYVLLPLCAFARPHVLFVFASCVLCTVSILLMALSVRGCLGLDGATEANAWLGFLSHMMFVGFPGSFAVRMQGKPAAAKASGDQ
jgi:hypothetical protein